MKTLETIKQDIVKRAFDKFMHQKPPPLNDITVSAAFGVDEVFKFLSEIGIDGAKWIYVGQTKDTGALGFTESLERANKNFNHPFSAYICKDDYLPAAAQILQLKQENAELKESKKTNSNHTLVHNEFLEQLKFERIEFRKKSEQLEAENLRLREVLKEAHVAFEKIDRFGYGVNFEKNLVITNTLDLALSVCNKIREVLSGKGEG